MKKYSTYETVSQNEALINELKGNLFEYLVGSFLSRKYDIEREFLKSFDGKIKRQLSGYESKLREIDPVLIERLPKLAMSTASALLPCLPEKISRLFVVGKVAGGSGDKSFGEADLLLEEAGEGGRTVPVGIKLSKENAFVNTKSGGVKSFLKNYFQGIPGVEDWQKRLNRFVDNSFVKMAGELYEIAGLPFQGRFDDAWCDNGYSELPGQLEKNMREVVSKSHCEIIEFIHQAFLSLCEESPHEFANSLYPLMGVSNEKIIQVTCFYGEEVRNGQRSRYLPGSISVLNHPMLMKEMEEVAIGDLKGNINSFEIKLANYLLQIRVKPMNKFTAPSVKINCSNKKIKKIKKKLDRFNPKQ